MIDKEIQRIAWSCLPKEFKEEVKRKHQLTDSECVAYEILNDLFGIHNLTSDAEGEDEMLCVKAKTISEMYAANQRIMKDFRGSIDGINADLINHILRQLFGSKCLPDESTDCTPVEVGVGENATTNNVDSSHGNVESLEPKPSEPKFKEGDIVRYRYDRKLYIVVCKTGKYHYTLRQYDCDIMMRDVLESDLEPYTEPSKEDSAVLHAESVKESRIANEESHLRNLSQETANCDKSETGFIPDARKCGTVYHRRKMDMAAMIAAGILAGSDFMANDCTKEAFDKLAEVSLDCAESIISKTLKGNGED